MLCIVRFLVVKMIDRVKKKKKKFFSTHCQVWRRAGSPKISNSLLYKISRLFLYFQKWSQYSLMQLRKYTHKRMNYSHPIRMTKRLVLLLEVDFWEMWLGNCWKLPELMKTWLNWQDYLDGECCWISQRFLGNVWWYRSRVLGRRASAAS